MRSDLSLTAYASGMVYAAFDIGDTLAASQYLLDRHVDEMLAEQDAADVFGPDGYPQTRYNIWRVEAVDQLLADHGLGPDDMDTDSLVAQAQEVPLDTASSDILRHGPGTRTEYARLVVDAYRAREEQFFEESGVYRMLDDLQQAMDGVAILTNNSYEGGEIYRDMFDRHLEQGVDAFVSSDHYRVDAEKPHWRPFDRLARGLNADPSDIVYLGNKQDGDLAAAARAGMHPLGVRFFRHTITDDRFPVVGDDLAADDIPDLWWPDHDISSAITRAAAEDGAEAI